MMDRKLLLRFSHVLFCLGLLLSISHRSSGQIINYVDGTLDITIKLIHPCSASPNGAIQFTVNATSAGEAAQLVIVGPPTLFPTQSVSPGNTFTFNAAQQLPARSYDWIIGDNANTIGSIIDPTTFPRLVLQDISTPTLSISKDVETNNSSCVTPDGQIQASIIGGSQTIGIGSYNYTWTSNNDTFTALPGSELTGTTTGATPLNLATLLGISGLKGGTYDIEISDNFSRCIATQTFTLTDPSPAVQILSPASPPAMNICSGDNITLTLSGSEAGVIYQIQRNGLPLATPITFVGTGAGPFVMSFPSTQFASGNSIQVSAKNGNCQEILMNGSVNLVINPLPTITGVVVGSVCAGSTFTNLNYTATTGAPTQYSIDFDLTAQGQNFVDVVNAPLTASPIVITVPGAAVAGNYNAILTVRNSTTLCSSVQIPITITIIALPVPTIISGPNDVCVNSTGNVYTTQPGKTNYVWSVTGGTITAGGGAGNNTATITWNTVGPQTVSINYTENTCNVATPGTYAVNVKALATPTIASGPNDVCLNSTGNVYTTQAAKTNYIWAVTGGTITAGGTSTSNTATITWNTVGPQTVSINYSEAGCPAATPSTYAVNVKPLPVPTVASGPNDVCVNATGNIYTTQAGKTNYVWAVTGGTITAGGGATDNTVTVTWTAAGAQTVSINYAENGCSAAVPATYAVNVKPLPVPTIASGPNDVCINSTGNVYTTQAGRTNYVWSVTGGTITAGGTATSNTATITWNTAGAQTVSINYTENGCTVAAPGTYAVNVKPLATPTITSGPNDVCVNSTGNVYVTQAGKTNYVWAVSGGTITAGGTATDNTVTVTWNTVGARTVSINYSESGCPAVAPVIYPVNVKALPTPTVASGPASVCVNSTGNVYTTQTGKTNYVWTVSAGGTITAGGGAANNTVTVTWNTAGPQSVSVNYTDIGCTAAAPSVYAVTVNALPVPTIISGPNDVCVNSTGNVYTTQTGKTNYVWSVVGGTITAGGGATNNTATITWNTSGAQSVSINYTENGCTVASPGTYAVNVKPLAVPTIVSGPNDVCVNSTGNLYTTQAGKTNYVWSVTGGTITAGGTATDNTATVTWTTAGARTVSINYAESGCPAAAPSTYAVNVKALPVPTVSSGPNDVCVNSTGNVYTTQPGKTNYAWVVSAGGTITAGGGPTNNTVTVTWSTVGNQTVSINYTENGCSIATPSVYAVNVKAIPTPTIASGPASACINSTGNVYTTQPGKTNYVWVVSPGGTITAGGGPTNSSVTITWTTAGAQSVSVNYTEAGCPSTTPGSLAVNVTSSPVLAAAQAKTICDGDAVGYEILLNPLNLPLGTVFSWPDPDGAGPATAGANVPMGIAGTIHINDVLTNSTGSPITISYVVTPSLTGCSGAAVPVDITVLPPPQINGLLIPSVCAGSATATFVYGSTVGSPDQFSIDFDDPSFTDITNAALTPAPVTFNILAAAPPAIYTATLTVRNSIAGCSSAGIPITLTLVGRPTPVITGPADVCENSTGNVYATLIGKPPYTWTVSAGGTITAGGGVNDNSVTVTWTALGAQNVSVNYTDNTCTAIAPTNYPVTVNPIPVLATTQAKTICSGDNVAYEILLNPVNLPAGTVFNWPDPDGAGPATAGVNVPMGVAGTLHINDVLTNATSTADVVTYAVTPSVGGCNGTPVDVDITVNPTPVVAPAQAKIICTGQSVAYEILLSPVNQPAGTLFSWPDPDGAGPATAGINVPAGAAGTLHINDILTNTTNAAITVTYTITPSLGSCVGTPEDIDITVNPLPVLVTPQVTNICSGDNVNHEILLNPANLPLGTTFSWPDPDGAGPATAGLNVPMGTAGTFHITDVLVNNTGAPITLTYNVTPSNGSCNGTARNVLVTIDPAPQLAASQAKTICTGDNVAYEILLSPANLPAGTVFNWPDPDGAGPATAGANVPMGLPGTTHINDVLTATGATVTVTYVVTPSIPSGCAGPAENVVITVNPIPVVAAGQTKTICSGANVGLEILLNPVNTPAATTFSWPDPDGAGPATAGVNVPAGLAGTVHIDDALTNATAAPITVTYVVTPNVGTCTGTAQNIDIIVDPFPAPVLTTPQAKTICSGDNVAYEILLTPANTPAGTLFNWPDPDGIGPATAGVNVAMGAAGTTHINDVLTTPGTVTYVITPVSASGCTGTARPVVITVNPSPVLVTGQTKTICSGANVGLEILLNPVNTPAGTTFSWPDPDGAGPATAGTNVPMGLAGTLHINDALTNSTAAPITVTYVVTPSVGACLGTAENIDIIVDPFPAPVLATSQAKTICSGDNVAYEILLNPANTPAGTLFNWPDPDGVGPATPGVNVAMGVAGTTHINDVLTAVGTVTYVITPVSASGCTGTPRPVVITVNPSPVLVTGQTKTICSGANVGLEILLNPVNTPAGTTFSWPDPDGAGPATAGTNVPMGLAGTLHINDALTNSTAAPITVTYVVTPSVGTCTGASENIDIIVDPFPAPVLAMPQAKTICSGENVAYEILLNPANQPPGTLFSWPDPDGTGPATAGVNVAMGPAGTTHINNILTNTTSLPITVTYVITPNSASGCSGTPQNVVITVNPAPALAATQSTVICSGDPVGYHILLNPAEQPVGTTFSWPDPDGAGPATAGTAVAMGGPTTIHINDVLTNTSGVPITVTYTVTPSLGTCTGTPQNITVVVRDASSPLCAPTGSDCANFSAIIPTITTQPSCNDRDAGVVSFNIARSNGTPTTFRVIWTYNGTDQTKFTNGTVAFNDLNSGLYKYTIVDEGNGKTCGPVDFFLDLKTQVEIQAKEVLSTVTCFGGSDGNVKLTVDGTTTGEYWYKYVVDGQESVAQTFTPGAPLPSGLPADDNDFIIIKVDESPAFSCPDTVMVRIKHAFPKIDFAVASTEVTTCNGTDGAIQVSGITGGNTTTSGRQIRLKREVPLSTDPSGYVTAVDFQNVNATFEYTGLAQGNYIVDIRDGADCIQSKPIAIQAPGQVPLSAVGIIATDASCANEGASGNIQVSISDPGIYQIAVSQDQVNVPPDEDFVAYNSPSLPSITFSNLIRGRYFLYIKSSTTQCPTRTDVIVIGGVYAVSDFDVISNCENVNITINNISGQQDAPFVIRVFSNDDKFFKIDSVAASGIPLSNSISFNYTAPLTHPFLAEPGTYRFVMVQSQTTGAGTCVLVSDTVVYEIGQQIGIVLGQIKPSFPDPKRTGAIEIDNIIGGTRFISGTNELYYEISLTTAGDDITVFDWAPAKLSPQNKFFVSFDYLPPGIYRVKVRDASGCIKVQDVEIALDPSVYVPNIFTPNDDSVNDEFEVLNLPITGKHKLIISNRWGNEVFSSEDYRQGNFWGAQGASDGIYFYRLKVEGGDVFTGWVEVLRGNKP